ncbi:FAD-binding oxidoreductase [Halalkalicoccus sp. NIPERK01]|uniref:NAD(P)/FAD-dependent oxidoreductase n=1 Tax=Halalkalicoccus sp. NIPERK01 TaxID=3053469 RepID=UPI00256ED2EB|nr:FAD-dependent oxidoreductase [Halalkalicoccus sp. NIPERK01]MDL5361936.1 FAD-dependent oxidoreductase [Halalkalicoccus sp. NIPERK01]
MTREIGIVGGGAVGLTAASDLAAAGEDVTLFERDALAAGSTGRAAGVLYDAYAGEIDARIGRRSIERFRELSGDGEFEFHETPYVWFAHEDDDRRGDAIREQVAGMKRHGIDAELLAPEDLADLAPALDTDDAGVAALARNAGWTDPATYAEVMAERARAAGVDIRTHTPVSLAEGGVLADGEREAFDVMIVAAGAHTKRILEEAGRSIAMKPYRVQALVLDAALETPMGYDASAGFYFRPHPDGLLVGDGTEEVESDPEGWNREADGAFVASALERTSERFGLPEPTVERAWAGLCTATPDGDPLLGWLADGLYVATGWQGHGFMRAPALGERIAREVRGEPGIGAFDPTRFTGEEEFPIVEGLAL